MTARHFSYYEDWKDAILTCSECGWTGRPRDGEMQFFRELLDVVCPQCPWNLDKPDEILAIVPYPTNEEVQAAAQAGNSEALKALASEEWRQVRWPKFQQARLTRPEQLPDLGGESLDFVLDMENSLDAKKTFNLVMMRGRIIWKESAWWENYKRFEEINDILKQKYGSRFRSFKVTDGAYMWLFGDILTPPVRVELVEPKKILVGPVKLAGRFVRYAEYADEAFTEEWEPAEGRWLRRRYTFADIAKSPLASDAEMEAAGIPQDERARGRWETEPGGS